MKKNLIAASSLVKHGVDGMIPVRIMATEPVTLHKGTSLGIVECFEMNECIRSLGVEQAVEENDTDILNLFQSQLCTLPKPSAESLKDILLEFRDVFSRSKMDIGCAVGVEHRILTGDAPPIALNPRRIPLALEDKVDELIDKLVQQNIIRPSHSPWNSPIVVVRKKNNDIRMCIDYRRLNSVTSRPIFPIPDSHQLFDTLEGAKYFTCLDLAQGYYQVPMAEEDIQKTAFTSRKGQFEFLRMPFGLCSAPATFQRLMHTILKNENWTQCLIYLDDILIHGRTVDEHAERLRTVLQRFREAGIKLSAEKCTFLKEEVEYLGHVINKSGIQASTSKIEKIKSWPQPTNPQDLRSFLGLCGYYRRHIRDYAVLVSPLEKACITSWRNKGRKNTKEQFIWENDQQQAFEKLKTALISAPVLAFPTIYGEYILDTDASHEATGAVLSQIQNGDEKVIAYASHKLSKAERSYCVTRKELLSVYRYVKQFSHYLYGRPFRIRTDHKALTWLLNWSKPTTSQYNNWIAELTEYDMKVEHRPGRLHANADALSRLPPCEQCELLHENPMKKRNVKDLRQSEKLANFRYISCSDTSQTTDPDIVIVMDALKAGKGHIQSPNEFKMVSRTAKMLWLQRTNLRIREGQLYLYEDGDVYRWVVPKGERKRLTFSFHKGLGHIGITKTVLAMKEKFYWPQMSFDIRILLNTCKPCQERKLPGFQNLPDIQQVTTNYPFEKIALDITGPLKPARTGERYILGIIDYFTKFPMLIPLHNVESKTVATALFKNWISLFGAPLVIHSDRGTSFESQLFQELCMICGILKTRTAPFYPQSDGLIERLFLTVKDMIYASTTASSKDWKECLPMLTMGLRSTIQKTTKVSPFEALFGCKMRTPLCWQYPEHFSKGPNIKTQRIANERVIMSEYIIDLNNQLERIHSQIRANYSQKRPKTKRVAEPYPVGTTVMAKILPTIKGINQPRYSGPYTIIQQLGSWTYRLQHCHTNEIIDRNIHHIKKSYLTKSLSHHTNIEDTEDRKDIRRSSRRRHQPTRYGFRT
jgi:hypothetical protein